MHLILDTFCFDRIIQIIYPLAHLLTDPVNQGKGQAHIYSFQRNEM